MPYGQLDSRAVDYVRKTRIERIDALLEEIERANAEAEKAAARLAKEKAFADMRI